MSIFLRDTTVSFNTRSPSVLGGRFDNLTVKGGELSLEVASTLVGAGDLAAKHIEVGLGLTAGSVPLPDANACTYVLFQDSNGTPIIFAVEWLDLASVEVTTRLTFDIRVSGALAPSDKAKVLDTLRSMFSATDVTIQSLTP